MKIMVGVNTLTSIDQIAYTNHCQFWFRLGRNHPDIDFCLSAPRRFSVDRMRNQTAMLALENDFDYILFLDDDVLVPVDGLAKLMKADCDIAAGHTIIRGYPYQNMFFKWLDEEHENMANDNDPVINDKGLIDCAAVGFSFVLIKTSLLRKVPPPYFVTGVKNTEDVYFCIKAQKYAPETTIVVDPSVKTAHILGSEVIEPDNRESYKRFFEESYPQWVTPPKHPDEDNIVGDRGPGYAKMVKERITTQGLINEHS